MLRDGRLALQPSFVITRMTAPLPFTLPARFGEGLRDIAARVVAQFAIFSLDSHKNRRRLGGSCAHGFPIFSPKPRSNGFFYIF